MRICPVVVGQQNTRAILSYWPLSLTSIVPFSATYVLHFLKNGLSPINFCERFWEFLASLLMVGLGVFGRGFAPFDWSARAGRLIAALAIAARLTVDGTTAGAIGIKAFSASSRALRACSETSGGNNFFSGLVVPLGQPPLLQRVGHPCLVRNPTM